VSLEPPQLNDLCASFQEAAGDILVDRTARAAARFRTEHPGADTLVVAGGVAANEYLRGRLEALAGRVALRLVLPPPRLCTDNGVMVAWAGVERLRLGLIDDLSVSARARWPLDPTAEPAAGAGVKA
jgi:N6-L-threonylcarbamoyladenine synthase